MFLVSNKRKTKMRGKKQFVCHAEDCAVGSGCNKLNYKNYPEIFKHSSDLRL